MIYFGKVLGTKDMKHITLSLFLGLFILGCDQGNFSPFAPNQNHFSMFGYLEADADTQFVRILKMNEIPIYTENLYNISAYLEDVKTGQKSILNEKIAKDSEGKTSHIFWTTDKLYKGATYRVVADAGNNQKSTATVEMPSGEIDVEGRAPWNNMNPTEEYPQNVILHNPKHLIRFKINFFLIDQRTKTPFVKSFNYGKTTYDIWGSPAFDIHATTLLKNITNNSRVSVAHIDVQNITVEMVAAEKPLPTFDDMEKYATLPENSNVSNGLGYVTSGMSFKRDWRPLVDYLQSWLRARRQWYD